MNSLDAVAAELFRRQAGVAATRQLVGLGFTPTQIEYRRQQGRWARTRSRVVRLVGAPITWESELLASVLLLGDRAVASHATAARLHGLRGYVNSPLIEFTVLDGCAIDAAGQVVHHSRRLDLIDLSSFRRQGPVDRHSKNLGVITEFRMTSPARTIIDLAARASATELGDLIDDVSSRGLATPAFVQRRLEGLRASGVSGVRKLLEAMLDAGGHSWLERRFLRLLREAGLPRPRTQVVFRRDGKTVARVDFLFDGTRVIAEVSGRRGHSSDADRAKDARRRNEL